MKSNRAFVVDSERVVHETIDGETILINLERGTYHSLNGSGPEIWALVSAGVGEAEIVRVLCERHDAGEELVAGELTRLVAGLEQQGLVAPGEPAEPAAIPAPDHGPRGFVAPALQSFDDMQYLLLLDPIHDFEASDWPSQRAGRPDGRAAA